MAECPKCRKHSGNDWSQCAFVCPMPGSPHYAPGWTREVGEINSLSLDVTALRAENEALRARLKTVEADTRERCAMTARKLLAGYDEGDDGFGVEDAIRRLT